MHCSIIRGVFTQRRIYCSKEVERSEEDILIRNKYGYDERTHTIVTVH
jgi:hypothetical protein